MGVILLATAAAVGCRPLSRDAWPAGACEPAVASRQAAQWTTRNFLVMFQAGPGTAEGTRSATYVVEVLGAGKDSRREFIASGHTTQNPPGNFIRVVEDVSGDAIVIEESIPNDCAPCANYIWVGRDHRGALTHTFLKLPTRAVSQIDFENPTVRGIRGSMLTYQFSDGPPVTVDIHSLETADNPQVSG